MSIANEISTNNCRPASGECQFHPTPLPPAWVVAGEPHARSLNLGQSADGLFTYGQWDCTAGQFVYHYGCDEVIHILEGEVRIVQGEQTRTLLPGDVAFFPAGTVAYWTVPHYVRKFCVFREVRRSLLARLWWKVKRLLGVGGG